MATAEAALPYREVINSTGRIFRIGETPRQILGYNRWVVIMAAWLAMCLAGLLEYTWGALSGSLQAAHNWGNAPTYWLFSFYVIFESFVQIGTGYLRNRGLLPVRWAVIIGGVICGIVGYGILAVSTNIWQAYLGYAALGGIGSGMVYSSCINIVAKWYPDRKGWRTGFVNGGWAYGSVPFIAAVGGFTAGGGVGDLSPHTVKVFIITQGIIMTVGIGIAGWFMKDPPKNWWPTEVDPLNWHKHSTRDLRNNPPALRHYTLQQMWRTKAAKWVGLQYACYVGCSLFGVAYYFPFAKAMGLGTVAAVSGVAGFSLTDGIFRPFYGWASEFIGRRRVMIYAYSGNVVFQLLALWMGELHNAPLFAVCAVVSGGLSGANFPMTAALVADYWGETNNAVNYGSIYAWKALGGSFAGGLAALVMTGTLYGTSHFHWVFGFFFGAALGLIAMLILRFWVTRPSEQEMEEAVRLSPDKAAAPKPAIA
ncbi:MAG TPA: OFA family MFS transporter [Streptosporangiaceae bacterium]|nr:OFA family MFS transporter [Streptosporangiaceae bacterium]